MKLLWKQGSSNDAFTRTCPVSCFLSLLPFDEDTKLYLFPLKVAPSWWQKRAVVCLSAGLGLDARHILWQLGLDHQKPGSLDQVVCIFYSWILPSVKNQSQGENSNTMLCNTEFIHLLKCWLLNKTNAIRIQLLLPSNFSRKMS